MTYPPDASIVSVFVIVSLEAAGQSVGLVIYPPEASTVSVLVIVSVEAAEQSVALVT